MRKWMVFILCIVFCLAISGCGVNKNNLPGEILINNRADEITTYLPEKNEFKSILKGNFNNELSFNADKTKILGYKSINEKEGDYTVIFEYDMVNDKISSVMEYDRSLGTGGKECIKYVPNSNKISFIANDKLYIFDRDKGEKTAILNEVDDQYSWDTNGEKILYADKDEKIYMYDMIKKEKQFICEGIHPVLSNNNEYIAYMAKDHILVVREIKTKKEWRGIDLLRDQRFVFSPDDKYLALAKQEYSIANNPYTIMYAVDYRKGKVTQLFKGDYSSYGFDWK